MARLTKEQQRENLAVAYSIIGGIPEKHFDLSRFSSTNSPGATEAAHCGTIGCSLGWLARHPYFMEQGLYIVRGYVQYKDPVIGGESENANKAADRLFGRGAFDRYFSTFGSGTKDSKLRDYWMYSCSKADNKKLALARLKDGYYDRKYTNPRKTNATSN
jgi:hypothetical protein